VEPGPAEGRHHRMRHPRVDGYPGYETAAEAECAGQPVLVNLVLPRVVGRGRADAILGQRGADDEGVEAHGAGLVPPYPPARSWSAFHFTQVASSLSTVRAAGAPGVPDAGISSCCGPVSVRSHCRSGPAHTAVPWWTCTRVAPSGARRTPTPAPRTVITPGPARTSIWVGGGLLGVTAIQSQPLSRRTRVGAASTSGARTASCEREPSRNACPLAVLSVIRPPTCVRTLSPSSSSVRSPAGVHPGAPFLWSSAGPPRVTTWAGSSFGWAQPGPPEIPARRPAPPTTATHMTLITLRPPEIRGDIPDSVARGGADTSQTPDRGRRARRARTPTRAPRPRAGRWRTSRRGPGPARRRPRRSAAEEWLALGAQRAGA